MNQATVIRSEAASVVRDHRGGSGIIPSEASLTYAFMSVVFQNDVYLFKDTDIYDGQIYLGEGATSTVYKTSVKPSVGRVQPQTVAVKQKRRRGSWFDEDISLRSWLRSSYLDMRIMSYKSLQKARNVTTILGYFWEKLDIDGKRLLSPCLVMPIAVAHTTSLDAYFKSIAQPGELQMNLKLRLCHDVANGIAELHSCGVIHGDIKLGNILLFGDLNEIESVSAKVADFSHSIVLSDYISPSNLNARPLYTGTRPFMIPEVRKQDMAMERLPLSGEPFSPIILENYRACDMYSLGILIYDIVHGGMSMSERICSIIIEKDMKNNLEHAGGLFVENCITYMYQLPGGLLGALKSSGLGPMKLESDVSNAVINCMDLCLQEEPNRRGEACSVVKLFSSLLETDSTLESSKSSSSSNSNSNCDSDSEDVVVPAMYGSLTEFAHILSKFIEPPIPDLLQTQIYNEILENSGGNSPEIEHLLASCSALGFGTAYDPLKALGHLLTAANLGDFSCEVVKHRVAQAIHPALEPAFTYSFPKFVQNALLGHFLNKPIQEYAERIRQLKVMAGSRGGLRLVVLSNSDDESHNLPTSRVTPDLQTEDPDTVRLGPKARRKTLDGNDEHQFNWFETIHTATEKVNEIDETFEDTMALLKIDTESGQERETSGFFIAAANFVGLNSSFSVQMRTLQCFKTVVKFKGVNEINEVNSLGETPLLICCRNGQALAVRYLLQVGADPTLSDRAGITPLHWLSMFDDEHMKPIGESLVIARAAINAVTTSPLDVPEHCLNFQDGCTPLHYAVGMRSLLAVKTLVALGADSFVETETARALQYYSLTPLHFAICLHFHEIARELIHIPGVTNNVMYRCNGEAEAKEISIVHLVGLHHLMMPSRMAPFASWVTHGTQRQEALEKTLDAITEVFPPKDVLYLLRHNSTMISIPPEEPWIIQTPKQKGFGPRKLSPPELSFEPNQAAHQDESWEFELWIRGAVDASALRKSSSSVMDIAFQDANANLARPKDDFLYSVVKHCAIRDMDGPLRSLLFHFKPVNWDDCAGYFITLAAAHDSTGVMELIWQHFNTRGSATIDQILSQGCSPLHEAAKANATRAIEFLLDRGFDIDLDSDDIGTPLCVAAQSFKSREAAILLLEKGANIYCAEEKGEGYTVLHAAVSNPDPHLKGEQQFCMVQILLETCPQRFLDDKEKVLNSVDCLGFTILHHAALKCDFKTVETLLDINVVKLTIVNELDMTPLMQAIQRRHAKSEYSEGFADYLINELGYEAESVRQDTSLFEQSWMDTDNQRIIDMLEAAGSPVPEIDAITGEFSFLLTLAAKEVFHHIHDPDINVRMRKAFEPFPFFQLGRGPNGERGTVMVTTDKQSLVIFPSGFFVGAPLLQLRMT